MPMNNQSPTFPSPNFAGAEILHRQAPRPRSGLSEVTQSSEPPTGIPECPEYLIVAFCQDTLGATGRGQCHLKIANPRMVRGVKDHINELDGQRLDYADGAFKPI